MIRIAQHDADVLQAITRAQAINQFRKQRFEIICFQQAQFTLLGPPHLGVIARHLGRQLFELSLRGVQL